MIATKSGQDRAKTRDLAAAHVLVQGPPVEAGSTATRPDPGDLDRCLGVGWTWPREQVERSCIAVRWVRARRVHCAPDASREATFTAPELGPEAELIERGPWSHDEDRCSGHVVTHGRQRGGGKLSVPFAGPPKGQSGRSATEPTTE